MYLIILKILFYLFLERGRKRESEGEKHQCERETSLGCLSHTPSGDLVHNSGMCPGLESSQQPFGLRDDAGPTTEPHHSRLICIYSHTLLFVNFRARQTLCLLYFDEKKYFSTQCLLGTHPTC